MPKRTALWHFLFDSLVRRTLRELKRDYPHIDFAVVLAYIPGSGTDDKYYAETLFPEGLECVPPRFAISWRNKWMLKKSDYVVCYVTHSWGGAAQFAEMAEKQQKQLTR